MEASISLPDSARRAVEAALSQQFGDARLHLAGGQNFWPSRVFRCGIVSSKADAPNTVIVRLPREGPARSGKLPLDNERAALEFLTALDCPLAPRFLAGGATAGFVVSEDIGKDPSLLDLLLSNDTETATQGTLAYAHALGTLHAQTMGQGAFRAGRRSIPCVSLPIAEPWQKVQTAVAALGLPIPQGVEQDIGEIIHILAESDAYLALSNGDPSVVNCKRVSSGVRFFDFEAACFRHALIDASVMRFFYPTGGPAWHMPQALTQRMEATYRSQLADACPLILDDAHYEFGMAAASAAWMILRMARLPSVDAGPDRDTWTLLPSAWTGAAPARSRRRQLISIIETCRQAAIRAGKLSDLSTWCERMIHALQSRWSEAHEPLPYYPAFL